MRGTRLTEAELATIRDRVESGWSGTAIAADLGRSSSAVSRAVRGITHRPKPPATRRGPDLSWMAEGNCSLWLFAFEALPTAAQIGVCRGTSPDQFPLAGECPVLDRCAEWGLEVPCIHVDDRAVFGGMPPEVRLRRQRERQAQSA